MSYVIILLLIIGMVIAYRTYRRIVAPFVLFCLGWLVVMSVHTFQILPYTALKPETQLCVFLLVVAFLIGSIIAGHARFPVAAKAEPLTIPQHQLYLRVILVLLIIGVIGVITLIVTNPVQLTLSTAFQRLSKGGNTDPPVFAAIHSLGLPALFSACLLSITLHANLLRDARLRNETLTGAWRIISRNYLRAMIVGGLVILVHDGVTLGRMFTSNYVILIFCTYVIISPLPNIHWKTLLKVGIAAGVVVLFAAVVTVLRSIATGADIFTSWLHYFCGPLGYFNLAVNGGLIQEMHWGRTTFMSVEAFFLRPFDWVPAIGKLVPDFPDYYADRQTYYFVGSNRLFYNAFGTVMLDPYYDWGALGIPVVGGLVGWTSTYLYRLAQHRRTPLILTMAIITSFWVCISPIMWGGGWQTIVGLMPFWMFGIDRIINMLQKRQLRTAQLRALAVRQLHRAGSA